MAVLELRACPSRRLVWGANSKFRVASVKIAYHEQIFNGNAAPRYGTPTPISALSKPQTIDRYRLGVLP